MFQEREYGMCTHKKKILVKLTLAKKKKCFNANIDITFLIPNGFKMFGLKLLMENQCYSHNCGYYD